MPMHDTSPKYVIPKDHITWWHLVELSQNILHAPTFCIHVNQASLHKDIWILSTLNDLLARAFSIPTKWHIFLLHLSKYFEYLLSMPIFDMYLYHAIPSDCILRWHLVEHPEHPCSHMWQKRQQGYNPQRHQPHNHFELPVHEFACPLQVLINLHMHWAQEQKWIGQKSCLFVAFLGKAQLSSHVVQP